MGTWIPTSSKLLIISAYASQELTVKRALWDYLLLLINRWDGECVIMDTLMKSARNKKDGFNKLVEDTWMHLNIEDSNGMIKLKKKLQALKIIIKEWPKNAKKCSYKKKSSIQSELSDFDKILDQGGSNEAIEGDENTKYFHEILNNKRSQLAIRGVLVNCNWIVKPNAVKSEFLKHFSSQFDLPNPHRICLADEFNNRLSLEQQEDLKRNVTIKEIKRAVWDYGTNKSPGPYEFTFEFFFRYWKFLKNDISAAFIDFFSSGTFPKGCNSSFIALIPKTQNAKTVKDFRPISLIGSMYKIIAKILANRLSFIIADLISDVQSAFVSNHQILDDLSILNELLSWCKYKKFKAMVFKEDFEKAFDSIR
ncbi:RNA-directed DNA polymerase, eukaryota [Tanacetum coccineum]